MESILNSNAQSIYLHIPFCKQKCNYCAFISFANHTEFQDTYTNALIKEISQFHSRKEIQTIYLGGGTPNLLSLDNFEKIITQLNENFTISNAAEITVELNPGLSNKTYLKSLKNLGVNRLSIGVQSFNDNILKTLNRIHDSKDAIKTIEDIKNVGFSNYSIDLIYGIFGQTLDDISYDLDKIKKINPPHVSTYGLKIEENTPFAKFDTKNLPDEELCEAMYLLISDTLEKSQYKHYEISNFAQNGFEAKHNLTYWKNEEYFGFGTAAHGYINSIRYNNTSNLKEYLNSPTKIETFTKNTKTDIFEEYVFLGLRLADGIDLSKIKNEFQIDLYKQKSDFIQQCIDNNLIEHNKDKLNLTTKGFLISNYIIGKLLD